MIDITPHPAPNSSTRSRVLARAKRPSKIASTEKRYPFLGWINVIEPSRIESRVSFSLVELAFVVMNAAEKGELYARIFRKVGVFLGKGEIPRALKELNEGMKIAELNGDSKMAARFAQETAKISKPK